MRDRAGRFIAGNPGGPGRPPRATEQERLDALHSAVSADDWREVCAAAVAAAINGDNKAREWLSKYLLPTVNDSHPTELRVIYTEEARRALREDADYLEYLRGKAVAEDETP